MGNDRSDGTDVDLEPLYEHAQRTGHMAYRFPVIDLAHSRREDKIPPAVCSTCGDVVAQ